LLRRAVKDGLMAYQEDGDGKEKSTFELTRRICFFVFKNIP
jgi:hypothetical protein